MEWADAVAFDRAIRSGHHGGINDAELRALGAYLHRGCRPLLGDALDEYVEGL